ncbi:MAG TPA: DNA recombination protein RmuC [Candidatus Sulfotelmatobacter sp.]|jgi:DNA recombination protein RmuC|nr:DNA recombination protein RmuC [Candidatus Sulfotelmatobacter sp.]
MTNDLLILVIIIITGFGFFFFFLNKKFSNLSKQETDKTLLEWLRTMQHSLEVTNKTLNESMQSNSTTMVRTLQENSKQLNERLDKAAEVIRDVGREVGQMSEIGRNMRELQDFLKNPKLRGNIGEQILKDMITQIFPKNNFHLQYEFLSGEKVDAAIQTDAGILPIDAKFPMENFQKLAKAKTEEEIKILRKDFTRDIKKHIDAIAKKYILPAEGTMDFALMYVPSEAVFYEIVNMDDLVEYARQQRVYVVSPTTLYAHLQAILLSYEGHKIEEKSREILKLLRGLQIDYDKVTDSLDVLGKHLGNASNQYMNVNKSFIGLGQKISTIKQLGNTVQKEEQKKPE